jgi:hypothetical protein
MKIREKINFDTDELIKYGPINIVALGDSVTHGMFKGSEIDYEAVYWNRLRKKIYEIKSFVPVNVINAGIGGTTAKTAVDRVDEQVLIHKPDLITICFGLNDVGGALDIFISSLGEIFEKCKESGSDVIYMTPNMLNTYIADDTLPCDKEYAVRTCEWQNGGKMDLFMKEACKCAKKFSVEVCDCYSKWKELSASQDTTLMLTNRVNHPTREMHELFAQSLFDMIFDDATKNMQ